MSEKDRFLEFFKEFGVKGSPVSPEDVVLEMDQDVDWKSALSIGQLWFLFGQDDEYLGLRNDESMEFEAREN
jgi:hypothetical protein